MKITVNATESSFKYDDEGAEFLSNLCKLSNIKFYRKDKTTPMDYFMYNKRCMTFSLPANVIQVKKLVAVLTELNLNEITIK